ncbi:uncharacterized protein BJX67DRAFT_363895 [Aspergillus lucknowensis]|uniref:Uncharacterized protein n=1 Tax=Aspergillus lucknowensis TaxID=176173 RepID=A0ABR4LFT5_9EURO
MGLQTLRGIGYSTSTFPRSPPGTPQTAFLGSVSFEGTAYGRAGQYQQKLKQASSSGISDLSLDSGEHQHNARSPGQTSRSKSEADVPNARYVSQLYTPPTSFRPTMPVCRRRDLQGCQKKIVGKDRTKRAPSHSLVQVKDWSNWEVRLLDSLDRRLEWLSCQLSPGRRTYNFALLANHWLNAETWIVYDPISRVSIDSRRRLGDPRFNVPYPTPDWTPRPKYPKAHHRPAQTPKINSWRAAMNRNRRASGLREFIKGIELHDSSAEDPPDGKVDPASWILRKPPQGYALSIRQAEAYYEGGAGWQEKLSDWQKVRRGYRVMKAIHEGRVNRTRMKEIAYVISRRCQQATLRLYPPEDGREGSEEPSAEDMP